MKENSKRNTIIISGLFVAILVMAVGYAALAASLTINGTATTGDATWKIEFESITKNTSLSTADAVEVAEPTASGTAATFSVKLPKPGSKIVYDLVVENKGSIDATLKQITGVEALNSAAPTAITYKVDRLDGANGSVTTSTGDLDNTTGKHYFRVTVEWPSVDNQTIPTGETTKTGTISLDYVQKAE